MDDNRNKVIREVCILLVPMLSFEPLSGVLIHLPFAVCRVAPFGWETQQTPGRDMKIIDGDSGEAVERFPVTLIQQPTAFNHNTHIYDNILIFTVQHPEEAQGNQQRSSLLSPPLSLFSSRSILLPRYETSLML